MRKPLFVFLAGFFLAGAAHAALFTQFVVFGDSLSDNGNAFIGTGGAIPAPPAYTAGRFTDGPDTSPAGTPGGIWHEVLSGLLGEPVSTPFLAGGTNFAVGGAKILPGDPLIPSLTQQVGIALAAGGGLADPNALYVFWGGSNDLYSAVETPGATPADIAATETAMVNGLVNSIGALSAAGARNFLWLNLPQLATTPRGAADPLNAALAQASTQFRIDVATETILLKQALGIRIADVDIYGLYQNIVTNPAAFGYTNVTTPAQGLPVNPDTFLFWDAPSHPTTPGHRLIALDADAAIVSTFAPEPATSVAAATAVFLLVLIRFRRRAREGAPEQPVCVD
jgi:phospholipase/lecithinase/hemolysin